MVCDNNEIRILNVSASGKGGLEVFASELEKELNKEFNITTIKHENISNIIPQLLRSDIAILHRPRLIKKLIIFFPFIRDKKIIVFNHGKVSWKKDIFHAILYSRVNKFIAICERMAESMRKNWAVDPQKIITIYLGVDEKKFSFSPELRQYIREKLKIEKDEIVFGVVGKIERRKNQELIIKAVSSSENLKNERIKMVFVGEAVDENYYKKVLKIVREKGLENKVVFLPFTEEINKIYNAFDFLVITSKREPFGLVGLEALATKIPVIAPDEAGVSEVLEDGKDSFIYKTNDEKSLAEKIKIALGTSEEKRKTMGEYGRRKIEEKFTMKRCASDIKKVIYELISSSPKNKAKVLE
jgi:glycosyltransferase involved in cell wall biosynthesis